MATDACLPAARSASRICWMKWRWAAGAGVSEDMNEKQEGCKSANRRERLCKSAKVGSGDEGFEAGEGGVAAEDAEDAEATEAGED